MTKLLLIGLGGALGSMLRYGVSEAFRHQTGFPWGTLTVNITGCFVIGLLASLLSGPAAIRDELRVFLFVGLLGGYTTFSAFGRETIAMVHEHRYAPAATYVLLSNALGLAAVWLGHAIMRK